MLDNEPCEVLYFNISAVTLISDFMLVGLEEILQKDNNIIDEWKSVVIFLFYYYLRDISYEILYTNRA